MAEDALREDVRNAPAGLGAAGVDDPRTRMASLEAELAIELDAQVDEIGNPRRRLGRESGDSARAAEAPPCFERVGSVVRRIVAFAQRSCDTALRQITRRRAQRPLRDQRHVCLAGDTQGCVQAGDAPADDHEIAAVHFRLLWSRVHVSGCLSASFRL